MWQVSRLVVEEGPNTAVWPMKRSSLFVSLRLDDAGAIDAFVWMKQQADAAQEAIGGITMSWGIVLLRRNGRDRLC